MGRKASYKMMGYRGYIGTNLSFGRSVPQNVQQLVIRDYCQRNGLKFLLSATEYHEGTIMLDSLLGSDIEGIVFYSLFLLPKDYKARWDLFHAMNHFKKELHFAAENMAIKKWPQYQSINDLCMLMDAYENNSQITEKILKEKYV